MNKTCLDTKMLDNLSRILGEIKNLRRSGWIKRSVKNPESDADHMYSVAFLVLMTAPDNLDKLHCLELALTHDLQEIYSSDYVPGEISPENKFHAEKTGMTRLARELNFPKLLQWFMEFEEQSTPEARFVKALDKTDNIFTARYYDDNQRSPVKLITEFSQTALQALEQIDSPETVSCAKIIKHLNS